MLSILNGDVLSLILKQDVSILTSVMRTCTDTVKLVKSWYTKRHCNLEGTRITLRFMQCVLRDTFKQMKESSMFFRAPKSFGKTISGYACIGECGVVLLPTTILNVWTTEAKKLGWYDPDPKKSRVIIFKGSKPHLLHIKAVVEGREPPNYPVILLSTYGSAFQAGEYMRKINTEEPKILVIDEAHNLTNKLKSALGSLNSNGQACDKGLFLSAEVMDPNDYGIAHYKKIKVENAERLPKVMWNILKSYDGGPDWKQVFNEAVLNNSKVVLSSIVTDLDHIIYLESRERGDVKLVKSKEYLGSKIFYSKSGLNTIENFNKYDGDAVLLINTMNNVGNNMLANAVVLPYAGSTNSTRITQTVGRLVRTTNKVKRVKVYLCAESMQNFMRCHYARCYYGDSWPYAYNTLPDLPYLLKCSSILKMLGSSVEDVDEVDGAVVFAASPDVPDPYKIIEWWNGNKSDDTILIEELIADLMCI